VKPRAIIAATLFLAGCSGEEANAPLDPLDLRMAFAGHTFQVESPDKPRYLVHFRLNGVADIVSAEPEFARWHADSRQGLCLQKQEAAAVCAPVYQLNVAHFRWGDTVLSDLTGP
jgi:hypothetical protein